MLKSNYTIKDNLTKEQLLGALSSRFTSWNAEALTEEIWNKINSYKETSVFIDGELRSRIDQAIERG